MSFLIVCLHKVEWVYYSTGIKEGQRYRARFSEVVVQAVVAVFVVFAVEVFAADGAHFPVFEFAFTEHGFLGSGDPEDRGSFQFDCFPGIFVEHRFADPVAALVFDDFVAQPGGFFLADEVAFLVKVAFVTPEVCFYLVSHGFLLFPSQIPQKRKHSALIVRQTTIIAMNVLFFISGSSASVSCFDDASGYVAIGQHGCEKTTEKSLIKFPRFQMFSTVSMFIGK